MNKQRNVVNYVDHLYRIDDVMKLSRHANKWMRNKWVKYIYSSWKLAQ